MHPLLMPFVSLFLSVFHLACPPELRMDLRHQRIETHVLALRRGTLKIQGLPTQGLQGRIRVERWDRDQMEIIANLRELDPGEIHLRIEDTKGQATLSTELHPDSGLSGLFADVSYTLRLPCRAQVRFLPSASTTSGLVGVEMQEVSIEMPDRRSGKGAVKGRGMRQHSS